MASSTRRPLAVAAFGIVAGYLGAALAPAAEAGLSIRQRSNGIPGRQQAGEVEQRLLAGTGKLRIEDARDKKARGVIVRLDKGVIWEIDPDLQEYTETSFEYWRGEREAAEKARREALEGVLEKHGDGRLTDVELEDWLVKRGLRRDGKRVLEVRRSRETVDDIAAERVSIELNGVTQVAVWQTDRYKDEYEPPEELFEFYDKGRFLPDEVVAALKREVTLFPVKIYANVDYFSHGAKIETRIVDVSEWPEDPKLFEVPPSYAKVEKFTERKPEPGREHRCPECGKAVDPRVTDFYEKLPSGGKVYFDTEDCWIKFGVRRTGK